MNSIRAVMLILIKPSETESRFLQVYMLKGLVDLVSKQVEHVNLGWGIFLVFGMFLTSVVQSLSQHHCFTGSQRVGMKVRSAVSSSVLSN
jgi:hypothetical protein